VNGPRPPWWDLGVLALAVVAALTPNAAAWPWIAGLAIATVGLGHGAFDLDLGARASTRLVARYIGLGVLTIVAWVVAPTLALVVFLAASVWHFGQAELVHLAPRRWITGYVSRGLLLVALPLFAHPTETMAVTEALGVPLALSKSVATGFAIVCVVQHLLWVLVALPPPARGRQLLAMAPAVLMLTALPLLVGFGLTFGLGHAVAHLSAVFERRPTAAAMLRAVGLWSASLLGAASIALALGYSVPTAELWAALFVMVSALTQPHMAVVERWHQRAAFRSPRRPRPRSPWPPGPDRRPS